MEGIISASKEDLVLCPGLGPQKVNKYWMNELMYIRRSDGTFVELLPWFCAHRRDDSTMCCTSPSSSQKQTTETPDRWCVTCLWKQLNKGITLNRHKQGLQGIQTIYTESQRNVYNVMAFKLRVSWYYFMEWYYLFIVVLLCNKIYIFCIIYMPFNVPFIELTQDKTNVKILCSFTKRYCSNTCNFSTANELLLLLLLKYIFFVIFAYIW